MDQQATDVVIDRITRLGESGIAAFDADGTLWSGDIGDDLFQAMVNDRAYSPSTRHALATEARVAAIEERATPTETVLALYDAFRRGTYPEERLLEVVAWGLAGRSEADVRAYVRDVLENTRALERVQDETMTMLRWLQAKNIPVYVVSASPREVVEEAVKLLGVEATHVVAATAVYNNGQMIADVVRPISYGAGKVAGLHAVAPGATLLAAFGDNYFDAEMLRAARVPVAVRPKAGLRNIAATIPGLVELTSAPAR